MAKMDKLPVPKPFSQAVHPNPHPSWSLLLCKKKEEENRTELTKKQRKGRGSKKFWGGPARRILWG